MLDTERHAEGVRNHLGKMVDGIGGIGAQVEHAVIGLRNRDACGDRFRDVANVGEGAGLLAVSKNRKGLAQHQPIHENANNITIRIGEVLMFTVNVVRAKDDVRQRKHLVRRAQI